MVNRAGYAAQAAAAEQRPELLGVDGEVFPDADSVDQKHGLAGGQGHQAEHEQGQVSPAGGRFALGVVGGRLSPVVILQSPGKKTIWKGLILQDPAGGVNWLAEPPF